MKRPAVVGVILALVCAVQIATAQEVSVPVFVTPPKLDGNFDPNQWANAARIDGFVTDGKLQRRAVQGFVGATDSTIYIAIRSRLPNSGPLLATVDRDSLKVVYDDAVEVFVDPSPDSVDRVSYHMIANSIGHAGYEAAERGSAVEGADWRGNWRIAQSQVDGFWTFECAIPISSMKNAGAGRKATDGVWLINLCRDWRPDWDWSSFTGKYLWSGLRFRFTDGSGPAVHQVIQGDPTYLPGGAASVQLELRNPTAQAISLQTSLDLTRNNMPEEKQVAAVSLAAHETKSVQIPLGTQDPTTLFDLNARVTSADGSRVYFSRALRWERAEGPVNWVTEKPADAPLVGLRFAYYPTRNRIRVAADISALPGDARPDRVVAVVREKVTGVEIKSQPLALDRFTDGKQEIEFDLPPLNGMYEVAVRVSGPNMKTAEAARTFQRKVFPWETSELGASTKVYAPFTPIELHGRELSTVLRKYTLNDQGLLDQIEATNATTGVARDLLAAPMSYHATVAGQDVSCAARALKVLSAQPNEARLAGQFKAGNLSATWDDTWDIDGTVRVTLTLGPSGGKPAPDLDLEIPLRADIASLIHANADRIRDPVAEKVPAGDGIVWDSSKVAYDTFIRNFCPYVFLGDANRGLCWFADNDRNWGWNRATPNLDVVRRGNQVVLWVHLVNESTVITSPRTIVFGLLAAPVKPRLNLSDNPNWWRYRFNRDRYFLLGTDINWFGNSSCGAVYPVGRDMYLWQMLARGNKSRLSDATIDAVARYGVKYFAPFGPDAVKMWIDHVQLNLRSHLGQKMIFYYNRASCEESEEFQTFQDEWSLDDFRPAVPLPAREEIKVVPSDSFIDYNLYWYIKSFEIGNNKGIYWDNWFIDPSFNTEMTDAYRTPDGAIMPSAGIWAMRALAKRTFQMMSERQIPPIIFPHMTSFSPLPMLSFATVQYDWEWKYSEGDLQDRFSRDYIQLVTLGEQAGVWPVVLPDELSLANDPATQRTFAAVRLVHELDGYGGGPIAQRLLLPIFSILDKPGTVAYRYWDDRPMPAHVGNADVPLLVYSRPGEEALIVATSYAATDVTAKVDVNWKALGLDPSAFITDAEGGGPVSVDHGQIVLPIRKHDIRIIHLQR